MYEGVIAALAVLIVLFKLDIRRFLWMEVWIDIAVTVGLGVALYGTFSGMMTAAIAGGIVSVVLACCKRTIPHNRPKLSWKGIRWVRYGKS